MRKTGRHRVLIHDADVLMGEEVQPRTSVLIEGSRIVALGADARRDGAFGHVRRVNRRGHYLVPGLLDLHTHGAAGVDFCRASPDEFARAMRFYIRQGVTGLLVSVYPDAWSRLLRTVERVAGLIRDRVGSGVAFGIHLEGPYLSPKRPGALPRQYFRPYRARELDALLDAGRGTVKTMTLAPERPRGAALIRHLRRRGVVPAMGHSDADYSGTRRAINLGTRYATHLFNAMRGIHHRDSGPVPALLEDPDVNVEVIADGHHLHIPVLRLVCRQKCPNRLLLVSDSVQPCGLKAGRYEFAGVPVRVRGGRVTLADGTLAGSVLTLPRAIRLLVNKVGVSPAEAFLAASRNPAVAVGEARRRGAVARGRRADLVLLNRRFVVEETWVGGECKYVRQRSG